MAHSKKTPKLNDAANKPDAQARDMYAGASPLPAPSLVIGHWDLDIRANTVRGVVLFLACASGLYFGLVLSAAAVAQEPQPPAADAANPQDATLTLYDVPRPRMDSLEPQVAEQIQSVAASAFTLAKKQGVSPVELADGFRTLGQLFQAYGLTDSAEACYLNATRVMPNDFSSFHLLGSLYQQAGRLPDAERCYATALRLNPQYLAAACNLGDVYVQLGRLPDARTQFLAVLQQDPNLAAAHDGLGETALAEHNYGESVKHFQAALDQVPAANRLHYSLAMAYRGMGDLAKAKQHLAQHGTVGVRPADPLVDVLPELMQGEHVHLIRGRMAFAAGRFEEAAKSFAKAVEADPESVRARVNWGTALAKSGEEDQAIEQFRAALQREPDNTNALFNLGSMLKDRKEFDAALKQFDAILKKNPSDLDAVLKSAKCLTALGRGDEAVNQLYKSLALVADDEAVLLDLAELLQSLSRHREARDLLDQAYNRAPSRGLTAHALARLLASCPDASLRDGPRAVDLATRVLKSRSEPNYAETLALALAETGRCDEAAKIQKQLVELAEKLESETLTGRLKTDLVRYEQGAPCRPQSEEPQPTPAKENPPAPQRDATPDEPPTKEG